MATTVIASFHQGLPIYRMPGVAVRVKVSGQSTEDAEPPGFAIRVSVDRFLLRGETACASVNSGRSLDNQHVSSREAAIYHRNEGDVVRAAALYLLHPVNQVLCALPGATGTIVCSSEYSKKGIRADVTYFKTPTRSGSQDRPFAAVEFKGRGAIKIQEFRNAEKPIDQRRSLAYWAEAAAGENRSTFYVLDSQILMKQASSYALTLRTKYIVLCNWDVMVLIRFTGLKHALTEKQMLGETVGEHCETTVIDLIRNSDQARLALLGFLIEAFEATPPDELP